MEPKLPVEIPASLKMVVPECIKDNGHSSHLVRYPGTVPHGIHHKRGSKPLALHIHMRGHHTNVDDRKIRNTGATQLPWAKIHPDCHRTKSVEPKHCGLAICFGNPRSDHSGLDLVREG